MQCCCDSMCEVKGKFPLCFSVETVEWRDEWSGENFGSRSLFGVYSECGKLKEKWIKIFVEHYRIVNCMCINCRPFLIMFIYCWFVKENGRDSEHFENLFVKNKKRKPVKNLVCGKTMFTGTIRVKICEACGLRPTDFQKRHNMTFGKPDEQLIDPYVSLDVDENHLGNRKLIRNISAHE